MYLRRYLDLGNILTNPVVFDVDYLPESLPFREGQMDELAREIVYFIRRGMRTNLFVYGPPGTGKTATLRKIMAEARTAFPSLRVAYVNAWKYRTRAGILGEVARQLGIATPLRGVSPDIVVERLELFSGKNKCLFVVDEADRLVSQQDVLYDLSRLGSRAMVITVANSREFLTLLDPRITSTLFQASIEYPPYTVPQLTEILRERARAGLRPGSYDEEVLRACAAVGFARGGDARAAIACLANSAKHAEERGSDRVEVDDVRAIKDSLVLKHDLDPNLQLVVDILSRKGPMTTSELYKEYSKHLRVTDRTLRNYLRELESLGVIVIERIKRRGNVRLVRLRN